MSAMPVDVLAVGPHPDDVDLGVGGTLLRLAEEGLRTAILDLTQGEMSSRGTVEERMEEAQNAAKKLDVLARENAALPDGQLQNTHEQRMKIIPFIRRFRPYLILAPMAPDRHPDHTAAHDLVRDANFYAGLTKIPGDPHRAAHILYYYPYHAVHTQPTFISDISAHYIQKKEALHCYTSQFYNPNYIGANTHVASKEFWEYVEHRAAYWGHQIGATYGEPLFAEAPVPFDMSCFGLPGSNNVIDLNPKKNA